MLSAFLVVMFSYGGAELIGVAVTETKDSQKVIPKIIKGTVVTGHSFLCLAYSYYLWNYPLERSDLSKTVLSFRFSVYQDFPELLM